MKIIILGAGQVGRSVAASLAVEANDITVVDIDAEALQELQDHLDLRTVCGHAAHPNVLMRAGAEDADMVLAVTSSDETNMVACQVAYTMFHTPTKVARVRAPEYLAARTLFAQDALPVDFLISPEQLVVEHIERLIRTPGSLQVMDFAQGRVRLVGVRVQDDSVLARRALRELPDLIPDFPVRVAAIFRHRSNVAPDGDTVLLPGDEVFLVASSDRMQSLMNLVVSQDGPSRRIIIAGGGNIGLRLAQKLEREFNIKVIEFSQRRAVELSRQLDKAIVLRGDAADGDLLLEENIENTDVFCAVTNDEQVNILSAMLAKRLGARKVMALINRGAYVDLVQSSLIDIAISPQQATIGSLLALVRRGDVAAVHSLRRGAAEAIEAVAHGDRKTSKVVGREVGQIKLPRGATIDAIVRDDQVMMAHHDTVIEADDHIIMFLSEKSRIGEIERLFEVGATFL
jgi:trk system potassium uptake protein TrkA